MYHVDWSLRIKILVYTDWCVERFCTELWVNSLVWYWKRICKLQLDLSQRQLDYSPDQKQLSIVYDACLRTIGLMLWFWLMSEMLHSLNCQEALHNVWVLCPQIAIILVNIYSRPAHLIILGASDIYSLKGTTLGDNAEVRKVCLADDISSSGSLEDLLW